MSEKEPTPTAVPEHDRKKTPPSQPSGNGGKTQRDEARDEGAGKKSVPIEDVTTANDK